MSELRRVHTDHAPAAIGPYSQAIVTDGWVFCSGQIPLDPATGALLEGTVTEQTHVIRIEKPFPNNITLAVDWQNTFSRSNIDILFNFDRQVVSWTVAWAF